MKDNEYSSNSPSAKNSRELNTELKKAPGVYDENPNPGLREYKHSMGKDTIPIKFAETITSNKPNPMTGASPDRLGKKAPVATTSTISKRKNKYDRVVKNKPLGHF